MAMAAALTAQPPIRFDSATIKPTNPASTEHSLSLAIGGRTASITGFTLAQLIQYAYQVAPFQISCGPPWTRTQRYDLKVKAIADSTVTQSQFHSLLARLLTDRFTLVIPHEYRRLPAWSLIVGKTGVKFREGTEDETKFDLSSGRVRAEKVPMSMLARVPGRHLERPIIDNTGLKSIKGPVEVLLIDRVERPS